VWRLAGVCGTDTAGVLNQEGLKEEVPSRLHDRVEKVDSQRAADSACARVLGQSGSQGVRR